jgi:hypothetical protein
LRLGEFLKLLKESDELSVVLVFTLSESINPLTSTSSVVRCFGF